MRIGINALAVSPERPGGDVSYVLEMVRRLPAIDPATEWVMFALPRARRLIGDLPSNTRLVSCAVPHRSIAARALWEQTALVPVAMRQRLDVLFAPVNVLPVGYPDRTLLTVHEAEPFMPDSRIPAPLLAWWRVMRTLSARRADRMLTVSDAARQQVVRWMGVSSRRLHVVHLGVDLDRFSASAGSGRHPLDGAAYILWVGRPYPRKNLGTLLDAFAVLRRKGRRERLVLIGPAGWNEAGLRSRITNEFESGSVLRLPTMWAELPRWYAHAQVFALPSTQETFGLPVLEAMACGTPVVAGDIPALREVGGQAALYVQPDRAADLAQALLHLLTDGDILAGRGPLQAARFTWSEAARRTYVHLRAVGSG